MRVEEVFEVVRRKRLAVVSTVHDSGPDAAERDRLRYLVDLAQRHQSGRRPAIALVVGWDDDITAQIEGDARQPVGNDLATAEEAYFHEWLDGRDREN